MHMFFHSAKWRLIIGIQPNAGHFGQMLGPGKLTYTFSAKHLQISAAALPIYAFVGRATWRGAEIH
jgi:hypothetical protein